MTDQVEATRSPVGRSWGRRDLAPAVRGLRPVLGVLGALCVPLALLCLWELSARHEWISPLILPPPKLVFQTAVELASTGQLQSELAESFLRVVQGLAIAILVGLPLGLGMGRSPTVDAYFGPFIRAIWFVPSLGWIPFLMLFLGLSEALKIAVIAKACFLPLLINAYEGARTIPRRYTELGRVLELDGGDRLRFIIIPSMIPVLFAGFRAAVGKGWQALVVVEMIASASGIGYLMTWGRTMFQLDILVVVIIVIGLTGWLIDFVLLRIQALLTIRFPAGG